MQKKDKEIVFPFFKGLIYPFEKISQRFKDFFLLLGSFSFLSAVLSLFAGRSFACGLGFDERMFFCENNVMAVVVNILLLFVLTSSFIHCWWLLGFEGKSLGDIRNMKVGKKDLKIFGFLFLFFSLCLFIGGVIYALLARKATPNLDFEIAWFIFVSLFIVAALFVLVNAVVFVRFLEGKKWLVFDKTALPVFDNIYKLMGWFLFYMLFFSYFIRETGKVFILCRRVFPIDLASFFADFAFFVVVYFMVAYAISLLKYQASYIFIDENND